uniref:Uncharacterized protein n=1 Tax=Pseudomonas phage Touem01 TaxID=3138548 RepID=A0AAU6W200_9VIRU
MSATSKRARVVAIHPEDHSCDVVILRDGSRLAGVQILSSSASTNTGLNDLVVPAASPGGDKWAASQKTGRDIIAIVDWCDGSPYIEGFLFPQICQMTFAEPNRKVDRHASDFYQTIDAKANVEWSHPSGTFLRIGESAAHEDLTGRDFDGKWAITNNKATAPHVHLTVASAGAVVATLDIAPSGAITLTGATLTATLTGSAKLVAPGGVLVDAPDAHFTGNIKADGEITDHTRSMQADRLIYNVHKHGNSPVPDAQM